MSRETVNKLADSNHQPTKSADQRHVIAEALRPPDSSMLTFIRICREQR